MARAHGVVDRDYAHKSVNCCVLLVVPLVRNGTSESAAKFRRSLATVHRVGQRSATSFPCCSVVLEVELCWRLVYGTYAKRKEFHMLSDRVVEAIHGPAVMSAGTRDD